VKKRLHQRMEAGGFDRVEDYIRHLKIFDPQGREFQQLMNLLTVNETYFFREFSQLQVFAESCLQEVIEHKIQTNNRTIKILCAGCSSGEEPYTLGIILREMIEQFSSWEVFIKAIDIDENILVAARKGVYDQRSIKDVPPPYLQRYFTVPSSGKYAIDQDIKDMVVFEHLNLMDRRALRYEEDYDFVFCRNVLIYFDDVSRKQVVDKFYGLLRSGGYIFLGHAESLSRISSAFKIRRLSNHIVYQR